MTEPTQSVIPCCPPLEKDTACDVLDFHYRLKHTSSVQHAGRRVQVEVLVHARFERCPGPMVLGDLVYSTTLLPGEKVRLFTSDRRSRFSFDSASKVSYRNEQTSEERFTPRACMISCPISRCAMRAAPAVPAVVPPRAMRRPAVR